MPIIITVEMSRRRSDTLLLPTCSELSIRLAFALNVVFQVRGTRYQFCPAINN